MKPIIKQSFILSISAAIYIGLVALFMNYAERILAGPDTILTGVAFLFLFTLSALVVGGLLIGKPIMLYIDGKKTESVKMLAANAGWMLIYFIIAIIILAIIK